MEMAGRVPYNTIGYSRIRAWCADVIDRALNNSVIDRNVNISQTQINELINGPERISRPNFCSNGYVLQILDAGATISRAGLHLPATSGTPTPARCIRLTCRLPAVV